MKKQINDLLLKMQNGENCIGETANQLLDLFAASQRSELLAFAKEMQNIGFNEMDDVEMVVDIYIKANCG